MKRAVVNVATGHYIPGQARLREAVGSQAQFFGWANEMPPGSPPHYAIPYAFKGWALKAAADAEYTTLLWADACILPIKPLDSLFEHIEQNGYWISNNGFANAEWTVPEAYADLGVTPEENEKIPHVVATAFGLDLAHPTGRYIFDEYLRLAQTHAFCGPVRLRHSTRVGRGDMEISGHRHDQTALSVVAHRSGCVLTDPPAWFCYRGAETEATVLVADSTYLL